MKRGKKYQDAVKAFDKKEQYDVADAIALVKKNATAKFDETIELHLRTGCDGRHAEQQIRGAVVLPHGTGNTFKVLVFANLRERLHTNLNHSIARSVSLSVSQPPQHPLILLYQRSCS